MAAAGSVRQGLVEPPAGTFILHSEPTDLLLDLDDERSVRQFVTRLADVDEYFPVVRIRIWPSRSKGTHAQVTIGRPASYAERLLLQTILGSDPLRELLNLVDVIDRNFPLDVVNVLFKPIRLRWCNAHQRRAERCEAGEGGIMLPCQIVDLTGQIEIEETPS